MSALLCGRKRSCLDEDLVSSKRSRCSSPHRIVNPSALHLLRSVFPNVNPQDLERILEECGNDQNAAIKKMHELCTGYGVDNSHSEKNTNWNEGMQNVNGNATALDGTIAPNDVPLTGSEWVQCIVREMASATTLDDATARASRFLGVFEKSISSRTIGDAVVDIQKENQVLKEKDQDISLLKRAVAIQHERLKEYDLRNQELTQLVSQYKEQLRTLELNNYALSMHLRTAQPSNSITGNFNPDVF